MSAELEHALAHTGKVLEAISHSHIVREIPLFRIAVAACRQYNDVRAAMFASKLESFVSEPSLHTPEARAEMQGQAESPDAKRIGETLFVVLERMTDLLKPIWLARCYAGYLAGEFGSSDFRRLASAIDMAFADDLLALIAAIEPILPDREPWKGHLVASGLTATHVSAPIGGTHTTVYVTELGRLFRDTVRKHSPRDS